MNRRLENKVALVTGGAAGIGAAIVRRFVAEGARVLNISSMADVTGQERHAVYGATKGAINALTKCTAVDWGRDRIRINALCPAGVRTETLRQWMKTQPDAAGFTALKLKVGSADPARDLRRAHLVREVAGPAVRVMLDANQQWTLPQALALCPRFRAIDPFWIEEPTHPDDVRGHATLAAAIAPLRLALGEHVPNRVVFKNYLQARGVGFLQVDAVRVAGVSEFLAVSMLARKFGVPVVPHVGDMGQLHQHLVLFNHIALAHEVVFFEHIPHLRAHFAHPAVVREGVCQTPPVAGATCDLRSSTP